MVSRIARSSTNWPTGAIPVPWGVGIVKGEFHWAGVDLNSFQNHEVFCERKNFPKVYLRYSPGVGFPIFFLLNV